MRGEKRRGEWEAREGRERERVVCVKTGRR